MVSRRLLPVACRIITRMRLAYLTDVEGRWDKLASFAEGNPLVSLVDGALRLADRLASRLQLRNAMLERLPDHDDRGQHLWLLGRHARSVREPTVNWMSVIRDGLVVRNLDGSAKSDDQAYKAIQRICRRAGLPARLFHTLRHSFGTHAALFGVNPCGCRRAWVSGSTRR